MVNEEREFDRKQMVLDLDVARTMLKTYSWSKVERYLEASKTYQGHAEELKLKIATKNY